MQRFRVTFEGDCVIELEDSVIEAVTDEWRNTFYDLYTPKDIAKHIAYNFIVNGHKLAELDGFADQPNENAMIIDGPYFEFEVEDDG